MPIKAASREEKRITLTGNVSCELRVGDRYFVRNPLEELDAPGEWYLDRTSHILYFWPPDSGAREGSVLDEVWAPVWFNREWKRFCTPFTGAWHQ